MDDEPAARAALSAELQLAFTDVAELAREGGVHFPEQCCVVALAICADGTGASPPWPAPLSSQGTGRP